MTMSRALRTEASNEYTWGRKLEFDVPEAEGEQEGSLQAEGEQEGGFRAESEQEGGVHAEGEQAAGIPTNTPRKVSKCEAAD